MPSPFPGMDPYLEQPRVWPDVHGALIYQFRTELVRQLPPHYSASVDVFVWVERRRPRSRRRLGKPDTFVSDLAPHAAIPVATPPGAGAVALTLPGVRSRRGPRRLQITDARHDRVVTAIELLSHVNKVGRGRREYSARRDTYFAAGTSLVEIDLLRAGRRAALGRPAPALNDYYALVSTASEYPRAWFQGFTVRDRLPTVAVPLAADDAPIAIDLKTCPESVYDDGGLSRLVDYRRPPRPPLREPDAAWARDLLADRSIPPGV